MDLEARLRAFAAVARRRSFSAAARELRISQPAVSKHIADIEKRLGVRLIERRRGELTAAGAFLANHDNVLFIGPSGIGKSHLLMGLGRALCLAGYRVLFRPAVTLATELEVARHPNCACRDCWQAIVALT